MVESKLKLYGVMNKRLLSEGAANVRHEISSNRHKKAVITVLIFIGNEMMQI